MTPHARPRTDKTGRDALARNAPRINVATVLLAYVFVVAVVGAAALGVTALAIGSAPGPLTVAACLTVATLITVGAPWGRAR